MSRRTPRTRWRCSSCELSLLDPCRLVGHRSEWTTLVNNRYEAAEPRRVVEAVAIANGVAVVPVSAA